MTLHARCKFVFHIVTFSLILGKIEAFSITPKQVLSLQKSGSHLKYLSVFSNLNMSAQKPSGSFFNQVPDRDDGEDKKKRATSNPIDPFEESLANILENRSRNIAKQPSTVGGIPTSKGFGKQPNMPKIINTKNTQSGKQSFIGIGKPLNDINKPEYDDQGYTLYADEQTGERKRVFEALIDYPSEFRMKIIGENQSTFESEMVQIVADSCMVSAENIKHTSRANGKWLSLTVHAPVQSAEMLYTLYENIDKDPRVKFKF